jgi:hypothetical protein
MLRSTTGAADDSLAASEFCANPQKRMRAKGCFVLVHRQASDVVPHHIDSGTA